MNPPLCPIFRTSLALLGSLMALSTSLPGQAAQVPYHVIARQSLAGGVKWDYLTDDPVRHHLFITHGDHVDVYDTLRHRVVGSIPHTNGVHGVALAQELDRGFISDGKDDRVTIFKLSTLKPLGTVAVGKKPDAIIYDAATRRVFAANGDSDSLSAIDAVTGKLLTDILLDAGPEFGAVDGKGRLFINIEDKNEVEVVDTRQLTVLRKYDLASAAACQAPASMAIDAASERLFIGCHNQKMVVLDGNDGRVLATPPIGRGSDAAAYDPRARLAFSSNGDGTLTVIDARARGKYEVRQEVKTMPTARTMALDPVSHRIYLVGAQIDHVEPPTPEKPHPRPHLKAGTFTLVTVAP